MTTPVYTVGDEILFDGCLNALPDDFVILGRNDYMPGSNVCKTIADAQVLIEYLDKQNEYAVYEVAATWETETTPSVVYPCHHLLIDARVIRKVSSKLT